MSTIVANSDGIMA